MDIVLKRLRLVYDSTLSYGKLKPLALINMIKIEEYLHSVKSITKVMGAGKFSSMGHVWVLHAKFLSTNSWDQCDQCGQCD